MPVDPHLRQVPGAAVRRVQVAWTAAGRQPGWVTRTAILAFLVVVALPIALLVTLALAVGVAVFAALALVSGLAGRIRGLIPSGARRDGRSNVRVIVRDDEPPH